MATVKKILLHYGPAVAFGAIGMYVSRFFQSGIENRMEESIDPSSLSDTYTCDHQFTTEMVSLDPLMIYINDFFSPYEVEYLLDLAAKVEYRNRTASQSFSVPTEDPVGVCITNRATDFVGFLPNRRFEELQVVRYTPGERHDFHTDWMTEPIQMEEGIICNRLLSFFVYLGNNCTGGETWFPYLPAAPKDCDGERFAHTNIGGELGFVAKPVPGNAMFWMNLYPNGTGDDRTAHAALEIIEGVKFGMNIIGEWCGPDPNLGEKKPVEV